MAGFIVGIVICIVVVPVYWVLCTVGILMIRGWRESYYGAFVGVICFVSTPLGIIVNLHVSNFPGLIIGSIISGVWLYNITNSNSNSNDK